MKTTGKGVKSKHDAAQGLRELLEEQLQDIYWAEKALTKAMHQLIENVTNNELKEVL